MKIFLKVGKVAREAEWGQGRKGSSFRDAGGGTFSQRYKEEAGRRPRLHGGEARESPPPREGDTMRLERGEWRSRGPRRARHS